MNPNYRNAKQHDDLSRGNQVSPINSADKRVPDSQAPIPSDDQVQRAKEWVDSNEK